MHFKRLRFRFFERGGEGVFVRFFSYTRPASLKEKYSPNQANFPLIWAMIFSIIGDSLAADGRVSWFPDISQRHLSPLVGSLLRFSHAVTRETGEKPLFAKKRRPAEKSRLTFFGCVTVCVCCCATVAILKGGRRNHVSSI